MINKEAILDCLINGGNYGECETQIKEYFDFIKEKATIEGIRKLIKEMMVENLICANDTWKNEHNETPYIITNKGRDFWNRINNK